MQPPGSRNPAARRLSTLINQFEKPCMETVNEVTPVTQNRTRNYLLRLLLSLICLTFAALSSGTAQADWIAGFPPEPGVGQSPTNLDITHWVLTVSYDGAGHFQAYSQWAGVGVMNNFSDPIYDIGPNTAIDIDMMLNPTTGAPLSGTLTILGDASSYFAASPSGTLLTGTISQFGFAGSGNAGSGTENFQFIFNTTGGDLASLYPTIAVNLTFAEVNFSGIFGNTPFFNTDSYTAQADTFAGPPSVTPVPEPASLSVLCFGALALSAGVGILRSAKVLRGSPKK